MSDKTKKLLQLATVQKAVQDLDKSIPGLCAINHANVHLLEYAFEYLFSDREDVKREEFPNSENPFKYSVEEFDTTFFCISTNPNLFPKYPVRKLAEDLVSQVSLQNKPIEYSIAYADGSYIMKHKDAFTDADQLVFSFRYGFHEALSKLEQAILDHMEVVHNEY